MGRTVFRAALALVVAIVVASAAARSQVPAGCPVPIGGGILGLLDRTFLGVARAEGYLYTADSYGLSVFSLADPLRPRLVGGLLLPHDGWDVGVGGGLAWVASAQPAIEVVNVTDPENPAEVGTVWFPGPVWQVEVVGNRLYALVGPGDWSPVLSLHVLDITDSSQPLPLGTLDLPSGGLRMVAAGDTVLIWRWSGEVSIIDVADPEHPVQTGRLVDGAEVGAVAVEGSRAVVVFENGLLRMVDLADPANPVVLGELESPHLQWSYSALLVGNTAYVSAVERLYVVDVADQEHPRLVSGAWTGVPAMEMAAGDGAVYTAGGRWLAAVDVRYPERPALAGSVSLPAAPVAAAAAGGLVGVALGDDGLALVDAADPARPRVVGRLQLAGPALGVVLSQDVAYVAAGEAGLVVVDLHAPGRPVVAGRLATSGPAVDVVVQGELAYVALREGELRVVDVSDPAHPTEVGSLRLPGRELTHIAVDGETACLVDVARPFSRLVIADVSTPSSPRELGEVEVADEIRALTFSEGVVAALTFNFDQFQVPPNPEMGAGVATINVSDPSAPRRLGFVSIDPYPTRWSAAALVRTGNLAFVGLADGSLTGVDLADPSAPTVGSIKLLDGGIAALAAGGAALYAAGEACGVRVLDLAEPVGPVRTAALGGGGEITGLAVTNGLAYVAGSETGLTVADVADPQDVTIAGRASTTGRARNVAVSGDVAVVSEALDWGLGLLEVVDVSDPGEPIVVATLSSWGGGGEVATVGSLAFEADSSRLWIVDVTDPVRPEPRGSLVFDLRTVTHLAASDELTVVTVAPEPFGPATLIEVDTSDPDNPVQTAGLELGGAARAVALSGETAYVLLYGPSLLVVDLAAPGGPVLRGQLQLPGEAGGLVVSGGRAFVAAGDGGVLVVDISSAEHPRLMGRAATARPAYEVAVEPTTGPVWIASHVGLEAFDPLSCRRPGPRRARGRLPPTR